MSNWSPQSVAEIAATQRELIDSAFHALAPGGVMVYSTCTLNAQENQQVVRWLLDTYGDAVSVEPLGALFPGADKALTAEGFLHVFPQIYDSEGFFVARLRKQRAVAPLAKPTYKVGKFPFIPLSGKEAALVARRRRIRLNGAMTAGCGSATRSSGCSRPSWNRCSVKCASHVSASSWRNDSRKVSAGSTRRQSRWPAPAANRISNWTPRWRRSGITAAISTRSSRRPAMNASSPTVASRWASPSASAAASRTTCRASWCATARWIFTCNRSGAGEPHPRRQNNANNIPIVIRYYSNHFQVALFRLPVRISPPEKKSF